MGKKKSERKPKSLGEAIGFHNLLSNEKTDFLLGMVVVAVAIFILVSMISFFSTGKADQSILEGLRPGEWLNTDRVFQNYCGSFGAIISYFFITLNFGLPAFIIPVFFILVGLKMMQIYSVNLWKWFFGLAITMIWLSVAFSKFLSPTMGNLIFDTGGKHGVYCVQHLENIVGVPGLISILIVTAIAFLTFLSSETINVVRKMLNPIGYIMKKIKVIVEYPNDEQTENIDESEEKQDSKTEKEDSEGGSDAEAPTVIVLTDPDKNKPNEESITPKITIETTKEPEKSDGTKSVPAPTIDAPINPREPFLNYKFPTLDLLKRYDNDGKPFVDRNEINANNEQIVRVLKSFGVDISEIKATVGPTITLYEITPADGVKISKIRNLEDDIALRLEAIGVRIIAPMPGRGTIGIEVPNKKANIVSMESLLNSRKFQETKMDLPLALGKTISNDVFMVDLAKIPHLLVAGATGMGKSVGLNAIITSLLYKKHPNELKLVLIDPKKVEFSPYMPIADHFMASLPENEEDPIITDVTKVVRTLNSLCTLMDARYNLLKTAVARNIKEYNEKFLNHELNPEKGHEYMPYIVVIIDEFGDLIMTAGKEVELPIARIAQLARAVGIHMIIATQRPTTNIITGTIKANFPGRMAFKVMSSIDSRTILDRPGANHLVGRGDMLILDGSNLIRVQCAFIDTPEIKRINDHIESQSGPVEPMILPEPVSTEDESGMGNGVNADLGGALDPYFEEAAMHIVTTQMGSTSMIQRRFSIGYNRAGRLMDQLEQAGIVGATHGAKPREVLIQDVNQLKTLLIQLKR